MPSKYHYIKLLQQVYNASGRRPLHSNSGASVPAFSLVHEDGCSLLLLLLSLPQESTLDVQLLSSSSRTGAGGALLYDYEYSLDSTRGLKRIFNTVTITGEAAAAHCPSLSCRHCR
eukprot:GHRQ01014467.1.p1 GENE.GHRQ01014467.1~~GHRQ01014467.1.p1  ORF type:complete len:116 (-),score=33.00 GHRQ01014467.1:568-915(-)